MKQIWLELGIGIAEMPLKYSCFISYRHSQDDIVSPLVSSLQTELSRWLDLQVYIDKNRLQGGNFFNKQLAQALCQSVCMIVVYTPTYFSKGYSYCAREYWAMEFLERQRLQVLGLSKNNQNGLIIPVVYRGSAKLPKSIKNARHYYDFEEFQISGRDNLADPEFAAQIRAIANYVDSRCDELRAKERRVIANCDTFGFPSEKKIEAWLEKMLPPKPTLPGRTRSP